MMKLMIWNKRRGLLFGFGVVAIFVAVFFMFGVLQHTLLSFAQQPRLVPIYSVQTDQPLVSLGINCAWSDEDIDTILQVLQDQQVKATFFLVGDWCDRYPQAVQKIADAGHELASHSDTHADFAQCDEATLRQEIDGVAQKIDRLTGQHIDLLRCPSGSYNNLALQTAQDMGYYVIQWDCDTLDWKGIDSQQIVENGTRKLQNGSILLLHSGADYTAQALPQLIARIRQKGYDLCPVGQLIYRENYTIDVTGRQIPNP